MNSFAETKLVHDGATTVCYAVDCPDEPVDATICLIASTGRGPEDFKTLAQQLVNSSYRVVMPWPRGIGGSSGPTESVNFHDLAADAVVALKEEAADGRVFVAGHAYGCWIARTIAQDYPELINGVILLAAGAGKWPAELSAAIDTAMDKEQGESARLDALRLAFFSPGHDPKPWLQGWHPGLVAMQRAARARTERESWWPSGKAPILDIVGLQDPFRPPDQRDFYVREFSPRVELVTIDGASHALPDEQPELVARHVKSWIDDL